MAEGGGGVLLRPTGALSSVACVHSFTRSRLEPAIRTLCAALVLATLLVAPAPVRGQDPVPPPVSDTLAPIQVPEVQPQAVPAEEDPGGVSPGGAFLRAVLVPGWGHASIGSHNRGGFYLAAQGGTAWMLVRTRSRLSDARKVVEIREAYARQALAREGITDPVAVEEALEEDEGVAAARRLEGARSQQFEDWMALGIFVVLLSGVDAFVGAHLQDFPVPVELQATPLPRGGLELGARVPIGR